PNPTENEGHKPNETNVQIGRRLRQFREGLQDGEKKVSQNDFAQSIGTFQVTVHNIEKGTRGISTEVLRGLAEAYPELDLRWLLTGLTRKEGKGDETGLAYISFTSKDSKLGQAVVKLFCGLHKSVGFSSEEYADLNPQYI